MRHAPAGFVEFTQSDLCPGMSLLGCLASQARSSTETPCRQVLQVGEAMKTARNLPLSPLKAVMSGDKLTPDGEAAPNGARAYRFRMDKPVAPYLIAPCLASPGQHFARGGSLIKAGAPGFALVDDSL